MAKKLIIAFLLESLLSSMIMLRGRKKLFDRSESYYYKGGFTNSYLAKEFEKKKFTDLVKMVRRDQSDLQFKKIKIYEKIFQA